jgi:dipeptide/tripeptide permease
MDLPLDHSLDSFSSPSVQASFSQHLFSLIIMKPLPGTGGIKPCVSSFGGDQFSHTQEKMLRLFFSIFYFAINAGSVIATFITPELRATSCLGEKTCYPWAFGLPAILMLVALALFCFGSSKYKRVQPSGSVVPTIIGVVSVGARARFAQGLRGGNIHWLDAAKARYDAGTVADVKQFMGVLYMFLPIPIFWALFDQQSSRWVFQAERMDGNLGFMEIKADQMQIFNSVFILILLPVFEKWIYPHMASVKQLHRMALGMLFAALAFIVAGLLEMAIDRTGVDQINIMWQIPQCVHHRSHSLLTLIYVAPQVYNYNCGRGADVPHWQ